MHKTNNIIFDFGEGKRIALSLPFASQITDIKTKHAIKIVAVCFILNDQYNAIKLAYPVNIYRHPCHDWTSDIGTAGDH